MPWGLDHAANPPVVHQRLKRGDVAAEHSRDKPIDHRYAGGGRCWNQGRGLGGCRVNFAVGEAAGDGVAFGVPAAVTGHDRRKKNRYEEQAERPHIRSTRPLPSSLTRPAGRA